MGWRTHGVEDFGYFYARVLGEIGTSAQEAIPDLIWVMQNRELGWAIESAYALGFIAPGSGMEAEIIAVLKDAKNDPNLGNTLRGTYAVGYVQSPSDGLQKDVIAQQVKEGRMATDWSKALKSAISSSISRIESLETNRVTTDNVSPTSKAQR